MQIGLQYHMKNVLIDDKIIKLEIWDTAGQERFRSLTTSFYRKADGIIMVFDLNQDDSFRNLQAWLGDIMEKTDENIVKVVVGNKSDLPCYVDGELIEDFTNTNKLPYFEVSAKTGYNITNLFETTARLMYSNFANGRPRILEDSMAPMKTGRVTLSKSMMQSSPPSHHREKCKC